MKMICFDMDGTLASLYTVPNWLEKLQAEDPSPYAEARPMWDMTKLAGVLEALIADGWQIRIISWLSKDSSESYKAAVRKAKLEWLDKWKFPYQKCHLVQYGTTKADCVRRIANPGILVDDNDKVREGWHLGETINPLSENLYERLALLLRAQ